MSTESTPTPVQIEEALTTFLVGAQKIVTDHREKNHPSLPKPTLRIEKGRRYARIVKDDGPHTSVYCFVDLTNGDILKSEGWKKPAKHARGSIFNSGASDSKRWRMRSSAAAGAAAAHTRAAAMPASSRSAESEKIVASDRPSA